ncbi:Por secretion system C-terminal sorting domain-containing protein [Dyadobacter soli]|uniref:Por secretion system C-terminal sorting domain-containing protein n=2 Tax=Dyadobacter soli TaxID=659014 RepID=A0A1G6UUY6_9BACT|nr:Por secretion system C-terminal sorting domain-containing protein [Dyadobacter soli]
MRRLLLAFSMILLVVASASAQTTWNGSADTNWNNPANWSNGVPDSDDVVTITPSVRSAMIYSGTNALARAVLVQLEATLTIMPGGKLTTSGSHEYVGQSAFTSAFMNVGIVDNEGEISIGSAGSAGTYGVYNIGNFNNNAGGKLLIDNTTEVGFYNVRGGLFNEGEVLVGTVGSVGTNGIWNDAQIIVYSGARITVDRSLVRGIRNNFDQSLGIFGWIKNDGEITIGAAADVGTRAFENFGAFQNNGTVKVDRATAVGFYNEYTASFVNYGVTTAGANVPATNSLFNGAYVDNKACGEIHLYGAVNNASNISNAGFFEVTASAAHVQNYDFENNGILSFPLGNPLENVENNQVIITPDTVSECESLSPAFEISGSDSGISGVFTDLAGTLSAGVYDAANNTFTPAEELTAGEHTFYVSIAQGTSCTRIVPWKLTLTPCCVVPVLTAPTIVQATCVTPSGTITINATGPGELEYSVDNGESWSDNAVFASLPAGEYNLKARVKGSLETCEAVYPGNPVVLNPSFTATTIDTWTGCASTDWNVAANWQDGTVPTADDAVTIPSVAKAPVIPNGATAAVKSLHIQSDAWLVIGTEATLTVNANAAYTAPFAFTAGIHNEGKVDNGGTIVVGVTSAGDFGIMNQGTFNHTGTDIRIDNSTNTAIFNAGGTFTNAAQLSLGSNAPIGLHGIWNDATFNNNTGGVIVLSNSSLRALVNNADEFKSIHATFNNAATIAIGVAASAGTVGIRNLGSFNNNAGGNIIIDQTTDIGLYNAAGTFTNTAYITIGANSGTGTHGLVNEGIFGHEGSASLWIGRATGSSLYHAAGTFNNGAEIIIGAGFSGGTTGIESRAAFNNLAGGDIKINRTSEVGLYHIAGTFTNDGDITVGNTEAVGLYGMRNTGEFKNNAGAEIRIDRSTTAGLLQANADAPAPNAIFTNAGNLTIGANAAVGADGLENQAGFTNTGTGHIRIDRATNIALKTPFGTFINEAEITIGGVASVGTYGLVNRSAFGNLGNGHIRIDRSTDTGLYHSGGTFTNDAKITLGANQSPGVNGIFNEAAFNNEDDGDIRIDGSTSSALRNFQNTFTNAGKITTGSVSYTGDFGIRNEATFLNNADGNISLEWSHDGVRSKGVFENAGTVQIGPPGKVTIMLTRDGGSFNNNSGGIFKGTGNINPLSLTSNGGTLSPGYSPGKLTFSTSHNFTSSTLDMELNGVGTAGTDFDQIAVNGTATLGGTLAVKVNYTPAIGDQFTILTATSISGMFSSLTGLALGWKIIYEPNEVKLRYEDPMPVTLVSFTARAENAIVRLTWRTTAEADNAGFYIERSTDAFNWHDIGFVDGNATTSVVKDYKFRDEKPVPGLSYYRLRQTDFDGTTEHSRVVPVRFADPEHSVTIWADAVRQVHIKSSEPIEKATVYDLSGKIVIISKASTLNLSRQPAGIVLVHVTTAGGTVVRKVLLY